MISYLLSIFLLTHSDSVSAQFSDEVQNTLSYKHFCSWCQLAENPAVEALNFSVQVNNLHMQSFEDFKLLQRNKDEYYPTGTNTVFFGDVYSTNFQVDPRNRSHWVIGAWFDITYQCTKVPTKPPWTGGKCNPNPSGPSCRPGPVLKENGKLY